MLHALHLENTGPAPKLDVEFGPRLTLLTGDNGLGKSFLLDCAWWAMTRRWPRDVAPALTSGYAARPTQKRDPAKIAFELDGKRKRRLRYEARYSPRDEAWIGKAGRPPNPGLVLYAHADGGFSVWDPARNYWRASGAPEVAERPTAYVFTPSSVWDGLQWMDQHGRGSVVCNGLIRDWSTWLRDPSGEGATSMKRALETLSPSASEPLRVSPKPVRLSTQDAREFPALLSPYGQPVPIVHASSGVRRVVALAYMLVWSWLEHRAAAEVLGVAPTESVTMLIDEVEAHLHPRWQRRILDAVLSLAEVLHRNAWIQLIAATHSPLILAGVEPVFDAKMDRWYDLDLVPGKEPRVALTERPFVRLGTAGKWLTSPAFDLATEGRPVQAEAAIVRANALRARPKPPSREELEAMDRELQSVLAELDTYWIRWSEWRDERLAATLGGSRR